MPAMELVKLVKYPSMLICSTDLEQTEVQLAAIAVSSGWGIK